MWVFKLVNLDDIDERLLFDDEFIDSVYKQKGNKMNKQIYMPDEEAPAVIAAARALGIGVGAYLVKLHKEDQERKAQGFHK